jgi:uncharacterized protein YjbI with pentapeptide repeats
MTQAELNKLVAEHEKWFRDNAQGNRLKLHRVDLCEMDLSGHRLSSAILEDVDLSRANLRATEFCYSELSRVKMCEADLSESEFDGAKLEDVDFSKADLRQAELFLGVSRRLKFDEAQMSEAKLIKADLANVSFYKANLENANLRRMDLHDGSFYLANLRGANLTATKLFDVDLRETDVTGADFAYAKGRIKVFGMKGVQPGYEEIAIGNVDVSPEGDGSEMISSEKYFKQFVKQNKT